MTAMQRKIIRANGTEELLPEALPAQVIADRLGAQVTSGVTLHHLGFTRWVMVCDDLGQQKALPPNSKATQLYLANCRPGTCVEIVGDVAILPESDYA